MLKNILEKKLQTSMESKLNVHTYMYVKGKGLDDLS